MRLENILEDNQSGSYIISANTLLWLSELVEKNQTNGEDPAKFRREILQKSSLILETQPNMALLHHVINAFMSVFDETLKTQNDPDKIFEAMKAELNTLRRVMEKNISSLAQNGAEELSSSQKVMTISFSTAVQNILLNCHRRNKHFQVFTLKSHPPDEGIALAEVLTKNSLNTTVIADTEMGVFMPQVDAVLLGADRIYEDGFINKTGSLPLCLTASYFKIPVYLAAETWKILPRSQKEITLTSKVKVAVKHPKTSSKVTI